MYPKKYALILSFFPSILVLLVPLEYAKNVTYAGQVHLSGNNYSFAFMQTYVTFGDIIKIAICIILLSLKRDCRAY